MIPAMFLYLKIGWIPFVLPLFILTIPIMALIPVYLILLLLVLPFNVKGNWKRIRQVGGFYGVLCTLRQLSIRVKATDDETNKKTNLTIYVL